MSQLQYADDLVVYVAHRLIGVVRGLIKTSYTSFGVFFDSVGLTISSSKSALRLSTQTKYVGRRCLKRINLLKSVTGVSWDASAV
jgi:hypothetical protein